jgi:hypothetical protein
MKPMSLVAWMAAASVVSWAVVAALVEPAARAATFSGMVGPLAVAAASWVLAERTWRRNPEELTRLMIGAFGGKMVFFGAYVAVMLEAVSLPPVPFVVSFAAYFIALHFVEALSLKRLFDGAMR